MPKDKSAKTLNDTVAKLDAYEAERRSLGSKYRNIVEQKADMLKRLTWLKNEAEDLQNDLQDFIDELSK